MPDTPLPLPDFVSWPNFPFEGDLRVRPLDPPVVPEPQRVGEDLADCESCASPDEAYIWVSERWRVRAMDKPSGLPMVLILESRSHLDLGDLPNLLAAELGVLIVRLERAMRSLDGVARVHVNRWGDGAAHLHLWFLARPYGQMQLRGSFLPMWQDILPPVPEQRWREDLALVAAWLADFGGRALAEPPRIEWRAPSRLGENTNGVLLDGDVPNGDDLTGGDLTGGSEAPNGSDLTRGGEATNGGDLTGGSASAAANSSAAAYEAATEAAITEQAATGPVGDTARGSTTE